MRHKCINKKHLLRYHRKKKKPQNLSSRMKSLIAYLDNNRNRIKLSISNMPVKKSEIIQVLRV